MQMRKYSILCETQRKRLPSADLDSSAHSPILKRAAQPRGVRLFLPTLHIDLWKYSVCPEVYLKSFLFLDFNFIFDKFAQSFLELCSTLKFWA